MVVDYSFGYVLVFNEDGTICKGKKCRTKYDADELAGELAVEFPNQLCVAMESYTAYRSRSKAEKVYLSYPSDSEAAPAEPAPEVAALSVVSVMEDF